MMSRQEQIRILITQFSEGEKITEQLVLTLFPKELDRFKGEFPDLNFSVVSTKRADRSKMYEVCIKNPSCS